MNKHQMKNYLYSEKLIFKFIILLIFKLFIIKTNNDGYNQNSKYYKFLTTYLFTRSCLKNYLIYCSELCRIHYHAILEMKTAKIVRDFRK